MLALICAMIVLIIFLAFPPALHMLDFPAALIEESWAYITFILPAFVLSMVYIAVRSRLSPRVTAADLYFSALPG